MPFSRSLFCILLRLPLPRKGTETSNKPNQDAKLITSYAYLFPARGRKLVELSVLVCSDEPSYTYLFPARGRKHLSSVVINGFAVRLHLPLPRKGTETLSSFSQKFD